MRPADWKERLTPAEITDPFDLLLILGVYGEPDDIAGRAVQAWLSEHRDEVSPDLLDNLRILAEVHDLIGDSQIIKTA